ncbi:MAG: hypothetical protein H6865_06140 [Rhodospirillales bacterium]|nr:hypothetical protein [Alphaproteobacteria bacterium]MCB9987201.1 hypothetical protein [Rhodospirillales bacterium]USO07937.1 MAG: hypothetical protein H6866_01560 [Rhodospirillales bacterium]
MPSLSLALRDAAANLLAFGANQKQYDTRNKFVRTLASIFNQAANDPQAADAVIHLLEQYAVLDPAQATENLLRFAGWMAQDMRVAKIYPKLESWAESGTAQAYFHDLMNKYVDWTHEEPGLLHLVGALHYGTDALTSENADLFTRISTLLARREDLHDQVAPVIKALIERADIPQEIKARALWTLEKSRDLQEDIAALDEDFFTRAAFPVYRAHIEEKESLGEQMKRMRTSVFSLTQDNRLAPVVLEMFDTIHARVLNHPTQIEEYRNNATIAADFAHTIATDASPDFPALKERAFAVSQPQAIAIEKSKASDAIERINEVNRFRKIIEYAISYARAERDKKIPPARIERIIELILPTLDTVLALPAEQSQEILKDIQKTLFDYNIPQLHNAVFSHLFEKIPATERTKFLDGLTSPDASGRFSKALEDCFGIPFHKITANMVETILAALPDDAARLNFVYDEALGGTLPDERFIGLVASVSAQNAALAWPVVRSACESACNFLDFEESQDDREQRQQIRLLTGRTLQAYMPHAYLLPPEHGPALAIVLDRVLEKAQTQDFGLTREDLTDMELFVHNYDGPVTARHPAFALKIEPAKNPAPAMA